MLPSLALAASVFAATLAGANDDCLRAIASTDPIITALNIDSAAYGDFNEDGRTDVAVMINDTRIIAINRGAVFEPLPLERMLPSGSAAFEAGIAAVTDINRDGHLDLVYRQFNTIWITLGRGDGTFQPQVRRVLPQSPDSYRIVDFNRDGTLDFVDFTSNGVIFLKSNVDGTYDEAAHVGLPSQGTHIVAGDFDGDGDIDLFWQNTNPDPFNAHVNFEWNDGAFHFAGPQEAIQLPLMEPLDIDGDGAEELVAIDDGKLVIARAKDHHLSVQRMSVAAPGLSQSFTAAVAADIDGDGIRDLFFRARNAIGFLRGMPGGVFSGAEFFALAGSSGLAAVDLNADGIVDLAPTRGAHGLRVLDGAALAAGRANANRVYPAGFSVADVKLADVDGDGIRDLVLASDPYDPGAPFRATVFFGDGRGLFPRAGAPLVSTTRATSHVGDFDGDGRADIAVASAEMTAAKFIAFGSSEGFGTSTLAIDADVLYGSVNLGAFAAPGLIALKGDDLRLITISASRSVTAAPIARVTPGTSIRVISSEPAAAAQIVLSNANGTKLLTRTATGWSESSPGSNAIGPFFDMNNDGRGDRVGASDNSVSVLFGESDGSYRSERFPSIGTVDSLTPSDVDGDGWLDLVVTSHGSFGAPGRAQYLRNVHGTFVPYATALTSAPFRNGGLVVDINGDGRPDTVIPSFDGAEVMLNVCASPRLAVVALSADGSAAKLVIHALSTDGNAIGQLTISQNGNVLASRNPYLAYDLATTSWTSPPLSIGKHTFQIKYQDQYAGASELSVDVLIPPPGFRRHASRH